MPVVEHVFVHDGCVVGAEVQAPSFESSYGNSIPGHGAELILLRTGIISRGLRGVGA